MNVIYFSSYRKCCDGVNFAYDNLKEKPQASNISSLFNIANKVEKMCEIFLLYPVGVRSYAY